ncbi:MAG: class I SAM-dependent methyltransferase [Myxococcota bacterium]
MDESRAESQNEMPRCGACDEPLAGGVGAERISVPDHEYRTPVRVEYHTCASCKSLTQVPMPDATQLATFYVPGYHSFAAGEAGRLARWKHRSRLAGLRPLLRDASEPLLDFGCGGGQFLFAAAEIIPNPLFGFEIAEDEAIDRHRDGRVVLIRGSVDFLVEALPKLRLVTMNHVIEHLPDPANTFRKLSERMLPGGIFEGQTPNPASLERWLFGPRWSGYHAPRHTVIFSPAGVRALFARLGIDDCPVRPAFNPAGIAVSLLSLRNGSEGGSIPRTGLSWYAGLAAACFGYPIERLANSPGMIDFVARTHDEAVKALG